MDAYILILLQNKAHCVKGYKCGIEEHNNCREHKL